MKVEGEAKAEEESRIDAEQGGNSVLICLNWCNSVLIVLCYKNLKNFVFILIKKCDIHLTTHSSTNRILEWKKYIQNTLWFSDQSWSVFLIFPNLSIFPPRSQQNRMEIFPDWIWLFGKSYKSRGLLCCRQEIPNGFWEGAGGTSSNLELLKLLPIMQLFYVCFFYCFNFGCVHCLQCWCFVNVLCLCQTGGKHVCVLCLCQTLPELRLSP